MVRFLCRNCNFKFSPKVPRLEPPSRCGNCGNVNCVEKEPDASEIIRDS